MKRMFVSLYCLIVFLVCLPFFIPINVLAQKNAPNPFPESQFVDIEGVNIHFRTWKTLENPIKGHILMIHGFCGSTFCWRKNIENLTENGYSVTAIDLPPFGYSDKKRGINHSISAQAHLMGNFLDYMNALNVQENAADTSKWTLVGHSMGGGVIAAMAAMRPNEIKSLIFVDAAIMSSDKNNVSGVTRWLLGTNYMYKIGEFAGKYFFFNEKKIEKLLVSAYGTKPDKEAVKGYLEGMNKKGTAGGIFEMSASKELYPYNIEKINVPSLLIWGDKDTWVPLKNGEIFKSRLKNARLEIIKGAAHCGMETHSDIFNTFVLNFLKENE